MPNPVTHFEILGPNGPALRDFYQSVFDWKINVMGGGMDYGMLDAQDGRGTGGGIGQSDTPKVTVYIEVDNVDAYLERIVAQGGRVTTPKQVIPNVVTFGEFADPQGNIIGLAEAMAR